MELEVSVLVKYCHPTQTKGARLKAWMAYGGKAAFFPYDHSINSEENRDMACIGLVKKLGFWKGSLGQRYFTRGFLGNGLYCFTLHNAHSRLEVPKH